MKRIAFITDIHLDEQFPLDHNTNPIKNFETVLADIENREITDLVFGGDIGEATAHHYFFDKLKKFPVHLILGNHDKFQHVKNHFIKDESKEELYYKTEDEHFQYIFLDTSTDELSKSQLDWLYDEMKSTKEIILFMHHPVLEIDTPVDKLYPLKNRDELRAILLQAKQGVTIFCGHYHMNDEQEFKHIKQFTTQSMSFQIVKNAAHLEIDNLNFGYRIIEINNKIIDTQTINFTKYNHKN